MAGAESEMWKVRRAALLEMSFCHVDFRFGSREIRLVLFGKTVAVGERERLVLGRGETADHQDQPRTLQPTIVSFLSHEKLTF